MEKINLKQGKHLLVIVDVINGFIYEGALSDSSIATIITPIVALTTQYLGADQNVVAFKDCHDEQAVEFLTYPPHCIRGTTETELVSQLKEFEEQLLVIEKNSTNGFMTDAFQELIMNHLYDTIVVTGCCTDICVLQFALSLKGYLNQNNHKTTVIIPANMVETFHAPNHDQNYYNEISLQLLENAGIQRYNHLEIEG